MVSVLSNTKLYRSFPCNRRDGVLDPLAERVEKLFGFAAQVRRRFEFLDPEFVHAALQLDQLLLFDFFAASFSRRFAF